MTTIQNINPQFGDSVTFSGASVPEAVAAMAAAITACGSGQPGDEWTTQPEDLAEGKDFEIVEP